MRGAHRAAIVGIGQSRIMRRTDLPLGLFADEAARIAIADAGLDISQIDGIACVPNQPFERDFTPTDGVDFVSRSYLMRTLGIETRWAANCDMILGQSMIEAVNAVEAGMCNYALVFRALRSPSGRYGRTRTEDFGGPAQYMAPYGRFPPTDWAPMWHRYQDTFGRGSREEMAPFVVQARRNGLLWDKGYWAQFKPEPLTTEQYLNARMVTTPFSILDCDLPVQAAGAFVVTTAERARDLKQKPAYVLGRAGAYFPTVENVLFQGFTYDHQVHAGSKVAGDLWRNSGLRASDADMAMVYDGFSFIAILWIEALGLCGPGEAFDFIKDGRIALNGEMPLNTNGGSLGCGRVHGIAHFMESVLQIRGDAGPRQVKDAGCIVTTVGTPSWSAGAFVFGSEPQG
jgi:acetyl-CoA acetyltransferase